MLSLPHAAIGAVIGISLPNPLLAIPLATLSHFAADLLPHWNPHLDTEHRQHGRLTLTTSGLVTIDFLLSAYLLFWLSQYSLTAALAGIWAIIPDLVEAPHYFLNLKIKPIEALIRFQRGHQFHIGPVPGIALQGIVLVLAFGYILSYLGLI